MVSECSTAPHGTAVTSRGRRDTLISNRATATCPRLRSVPLPARRPAHHVHVRRLWGTAVKVTAVRTSISHQPWGTSSCRGACSSGAWRSSIWSPLCLSTRRFQVRPAPLPVPVPKLSVSWLITPDAWRVVVCVSLLAVGRKRRLEVSPDFLAPS